MRIMTQDEFDKSGMRVVEGDHDYRTNPQGRRTYDSHYGVGFKRVFDTVRGVKRSVTMRFKGYPAEYCATRVAIVQHEMRQPIDWATGQEVGEPEHVGFSAHVVVVE